jgi:tetratricopeptide (TPR) repeat protein
VLSCSTEKNAALNRGFHNMTAHYNGYFNATEIIKESMKSFQDNYKEDYSKILPIYVIADEKSASTLYPEMDKAIKKTEMVIARHSMPNQEKIGKGKKKEEWNKWIDNNWFVMAQAHFYKRELEAALAKFEYVYKTYGYDPLSYDAQLWMARCLMELGRMSEAKTILDRLQKDMEDAAKMKFKPAKPESDKKKSKSKSTPNADKPDAIFPEYLQAELAKVQADYHIRRKEYDKAVDALKIAIAHTKKKRDRSRLTFILAQVYQSMGNTALASDTYALIPKLNPTFEMEFYSRINRALLYQGNDTKGIRAELMRLLKDEKNKDYYDQIYYALAELDFKDGQKIEGITNLKKSIAVSVSNDPQKGKAYLRLADLYFTDREYIDAKNYYDSALVFLPQDFAGYDRLRQKSVSLSELVTHLTTFRLQDSLLSLSSLSRERREKTVDEIIKREREEEERKQREEELKLQPVAGTQDEGDGKWYFYNEKIRSSGFNMFKQQWGVTRKLEDDWRRTNKATVELDNPENVQENPVGEDKWSKRREQLLDAIPSGPEEMNDAQQKIMIALYEAGVIYKDQLNQPDLAIKSFKELLSRYEEGELIPATNYQLYLLLQGKPEAEVYKNTILDKFGDSEYAQLIRNPNFKKDVDVRKSKEEDQYAEVYKLFESKQFDEVITRCNAIIAAEPDNFFLPKYYFLLAVTQGSKGNVDAMEKGLSETATKFPSDDAGKEATAILDYLRKKKSLESSKSGFGNYVYEADAEHYFVLIFPSSFGSITEASGKFSDFNNTYFSTNNYKTERPFLGTDTQMIVVKGIKNKKAAMEYYLAFLNENDKLKQYKSGKTFVITSKNYATFFIDKNIDKYYEFFEQNYVK